MSSQRSLKKMWSSASLIHDRQPDTSLDQGEDDQSQLDRLDKEAEQKKSEEPIESEIDDSFADQVGDQNRRAKKPRTKEPEQTETETFEEIADTFEETIEQNSPIRKMPRVDQKSMIKAALGKTGAKIIGSFAQCDLTKDNAKRINEAMKDLHQHRFDATNTNAAIPEGEKFTGNQKERKTYEALMSIKNNGGKIPSRSSIGNLVRKELREDKSIRDANDDDETFRWKWLNLKINH